MGYAVLNKLVFSLNLKRGRESRFLMSGGSEFQSQGAEWLKALLPMVTMGVRVNKIRMEISLLRRIV